MKKIRLKKRRIFFVLIIAFMIKQFIEAHIVYLQHAIDEDIVLLPGSISNTTQPPTANLFETRAWKWYNLYKVGKVRAKTLVNYEGYLKKHLLPYFGPRDICTISIDDVQEFMNSKAAYHAFSVYAISYKAKKELTKHQILVSSVG